MLLTILKHNNRNSCYFYSVGHSFSTYNIKVTLVLNLETFYYLLPELLLKSRELICPQVIQLLIFVSVFYPFYIF